MPSKLIDRKSLKEEYGLGSGVIEQIFERLEKQQIRPPGMRRVMLRRVDVDELIDSWTA